MKDQEFINRKADHIRYSLAKEAEAVESGSLHQWSLVHDSLPDLDLNEVSLEANWFETQKPNPFFIAGMTAGHPDAKLINERLARAASERGWAMGLGSQRRELDSDYKDSAVQSLRNQNPDLFLISNLGIAQLIELHERGSWNLLFDLLERSGASALAIHLNPLQEAIQPEGTPRFKNGWIAIRELANRIKLPLILKEEAVVGLCVGVVGVNLECSLEMFGGLDELLLILEYVAIVKVGRGVFGLNLEAGFEVFSGLLELPLLLEENGEVEMGFGVAGVNL
jgi:isopentenyl-diphosphate delta-isomerase type 2